MRATPHLSTWARARCIWPWGCSHGIARCRLQAVTAALVWYLIDKHAGPFERLGVLPVFFLGAAEVASGVSGL